MKKILLTSLSIAIVAFATAQSGNHVFAGAEAANFGTVDLATPGGQTWSTARSATPGYFSAVGTATYTSPSDAANVDGYVKHYSNVANQGFNYPVGTGTDYRNLTTSGTIPTASEFATAWIVGDPSGNLDPTSTGAAGGAHSITAVTGPVISVSPVGQWDWQDLSGTGAGVSISVSIPNVSTFATAANLRLVGWNGSSWVDLSGTATASGNTENSTLTGTMIANISAIGIGAITLLPIKLESFTGTAVGCNALLSWKSSEEINSAKYIVQQSANGVNFISVKEIASANASSGSTYNTTIPQNSNKNYYRLVMVDKDGKFEYSPIVTVKSNCNSRPSITIFPNPVKDIVTISNVLIGTKALLFKPNGQLINSITITSTTFTIDMSNYSKGIYILKFDGEESKIIIRE